HRAEESDPALLSRGTEDSLTVEVAEREGHRGEHSRLEARPEVRVLEAPVAPVEGVVHAPEEVAPDALVGPLTPVPPTVALRGKVVTASERCRTLAVAGLHVRGCIHSGRVIERLQREDVERLVRVLGQQLREGRSRGVPNQGAEFGELHSTTSLSEPNEERSIRRVRSTVSRAGRRRARRIDLCWTEPLCRRRPPGDWIGGLSSFTGHSTSRSAARNGPLTAFASLAVFAPGRRVVPDRSLATAPCLACSDAPFVKARAAARPVWPVHRPGPSPHSRTVLSARRPADQFHHPHRADPARRA